MFHSALKVALLTSGLVAAVSICRAQTPAAEPSADQTLIAEAPVAETPEGVVDAGSLAGNPPPNATVSARTTAPFVYKPMTQSDRFRHYAKGLFSFESVARATAGAGIAQLTNAPNEWGQGLDGYARRFGNSMGEHLIRSTIMYGVSSALDEDNRYFRSNRTGFGSRTMYAVESTFLARRSDGTRKFSYSRLIGLVATAFISREWQPPSTHGPQHAAGSFATALGSEVGFNVVRELLPDLLHRH